MLQRYGNDVLILDSTHGTNGYGYEMTTVMVIDSHRRGFTVAHMIASRTDEDLLRFFFALLRKATGVFTVKTFMTDDFPAFANAWSLAMVPPSNILLCTWHVLRAWTKNINSKIKDPVDRRKCMEDARSMLTETEEPDFQSLLRDFLVTWGE